jgi:hypothetical protein
MNPATDTGYLRPRDPVEIWLARQWQDVLGFGVGIRERFFQIGGNSLDAARIVNAVLAEFGVQLPLNVLTEYPTVEGLAGRLREQNERLAGPLVQIQHGDGTHPPLVLVHPADGQVGSYCQLAYLLGDEFTLFGLQAAALYADTEPIRTVSAMADAYLDAVRVAQPTGPYLLGGCGTGAVVAHEMAAHLAATGDEVRLLAAIEPELLEPRDIVVDAWSRELPRQGQLAEILRAWQDHDRVPRDATPDFVARSVRVWQANQDAVRDWRPRPHDGPLDVFGTGERPSIVDRPAAGGSGVHIGSRVHECATGDELAGVLRELIG